MSKIVVIIGRPNTGKSTLFNRLIGRPQAITQNVPGITRDTHYQVVNWQKNSFTIVDTGGYITQNPTEYDKAVLQQANLALTQAALILFVVDAKTSLIEADKSIIEHLRTLNKRIFIIVNKIDDHQARLQVPAFHTLGIPHLYPISSTHGIGTGDLLDAIVKTLYENQHNQDPALSPPTLPRIALIGRPNTGKSTMINSLLGQSKQIVNNKPNTTRDAIDSHYTLFNKSCVLTDTAGIQQKIKNKDDTAFYATLRSIRAINRSDVCLVLIEAKQGLTKQELQLIKLAWERHKGVIILVNKCDLLVETIDENAQKYREKIREGLGNMFDIPILFTSGMKKKRIYQAIEKALQIYKKRQERIPTLQLNKVLLKAIQTTSPPTKRGKTIQIKYITQLPRPTPIFALFCNHPEHIPENYKSYLMRKLREYFDFQGVPITLVFKKK